MSELVWSSWGVQHVLVKPSWEDKVDADMAGVTVEQHMFNKWISDGSIGFDLLPEGWRVKLSRWKYFLWPVLSRRVLGTEKMNFIGWSIGHCLNCDASPYDGVVEAWTIISTVYDASSRVHVALTPAAHGALIRCGKCGQLRWQESTRWQESA